MKQHRWRWVISVVVVAGAVALFWPTRSGEQRAAEALRQELRQQGFKTEPTDFNLDIGAEARSRFHRLTNDLPGTYMGGFPFAAFMANPVGSNSARVLWKEPRLPTRESPDEWVELREWLAEIEEPLDTARDAVMAGPIRSEPIGPLGPGMLLPHLSRFKTMAQVLALRSALRLRDGQPADAWEDVRAVSRLATDLHPEPIRVSQTVRAALVTLAQQTLWEALQHPAFFEAQLLDLQREWESVDLLKDLPEMAAFDRVSYLSACRDRRAEPMTNYVATFGETLSAAWLSPKHSPTIIREWLARRYKEVRYRSHGVFEDEERIMRYHTEEELELRKAVAQSSWAAICSQSRATNEFPFAGADGSDMAAAINMRRYTFQIMLSLTDSGGWIGRMSEAETRRRLVIVALALSRYRLNRGAFPDSLEELAPQYLATIPADFMDGRPLRYRRVGDRFLLYSVGLDGQDDGGSSPRVDPRASFEIPPEIEPKPITRDLLWPLPASDEQLAEERDQAVVDWAEHASSRWAFWQIATLVEAGLLPDGAIRSQFPGEYSEIEDSASPLSEGEADTAGAE